MKISSLAVATIAQALIEEEYDDLIEEEEVEDDTDLPLKQAKSRVQRSHNGRKRRFINSIFTELGPYYVVRAYRMDCPAFWKLLQMVNPYLDAQSVFKNKKADDSTQRGGGAKNGLISNATRLSCALRYFAGRRAEDISLVHGISHCQVFRSVWRVVDAVNTAMELKFEYPADHTQQKAVAKEFKECSQAGFDNCGGAMDGMMIWTECPTLASCEAAMCGRLKFFCGRKKKYGIGLQAICDAHGRFLDLFMGHPATTSDFLAFSTSPIYYKLKEQGFLAAGIVLYGDSAYVATDYMATPYKNIRTGPKDDYNFYHSQVSCTDRCHSPSPARTHLLRNFVGEQVRIKIECAFGMFVNRWGLLRRALPAAISLKKVPQLVMCLARLHNYCISERLANKKTVKLAPALAIDQAEIAANGGIPGDTIPQQLLHAGEHFEDVTTNMRRSLQYRARKDNSKLPMEHMLDSVVAQGLKRPDPKGWTGRK